MVTEAVGGGWGPSAAKVFMKISKTKALMTGAQNNKIHSHFYHMTGTIIHKENARAILQRCSVTPKERQVLSMAALLQSAAAEDAPQSQHS